MDEKLTKNLSPLKMRDSYFKDLPKVARQSKRSVADYRRFIIETAIDKWREEQLKK